jgi:hypothetical protein
MFFYGGGGEKGLKICPSSMEIIGHERLLEISDTYAVYTSRQLIM